MNPGRFSPKLPIALLFVAFQVFPQVNPNATIIDAGSDGDRNFAGGTKYIIAPTPDVVDVTLRYGAFTYEFPAHNEWPYVLTLRFIEPTVQSPGQRVFSVRVNNQLVLDRLDLVAEAGYLKPLSRSVLVMGADNRLVIKFEVQVRSAVISSIEITPLFQILSGAN